MAESLVPPPTQPSFGCANCFVFDWEQPEDRSTLRNCGRCKLLKYCSKECQEEHWELVHKKHCRKLMLAKEEAEQLEKRGDVSSVGLFSHHPFPLSGQLKDTTEMLVDLVQRILLKMEQTGHPAWDLDEVKQLEVSMDKCRKTIWAERKLFPKIKQVALGFPFSVPDKSLLFDPNKLWSTLHLVLGRLQSQNILVALTTMKDPLSSVPEELWQLVEREVGSSFPARLQNLLQAFTGDQVPTFLDLLKVFCGGTLLHKCSFCSANLSLQWKAR